MAVDTRKKRGSAIGVGPSTPVLPDPDGAIDASDRKQLAHSYSRARANPPPLGWNVIRAGGIRARITAR